MARGRGIMSSSNSGQDHRHYRIRGRATKRKAHVNGSRAKTRPGVGFFRECPECPWQQSANNKQMQPVRLPADAKICQEGHKVQERGGYRL